MGCVGYLVWRLCSLEGVGSRHWTGQPQNPNCTYVLLCVYIVVYSIRFIFLAKCIIALAEPGHIQDEL